MVLQEYISWLKENRLGDLVDKNLELADEQNISLIERFKDLPREELKELTRRSLSEFLESLQRGDALQRLETLMYDFEAGKLKNNIAKDTIQPSDIVLVNNAQSRAIVTFIPEFTSKSEDAVAIVNELSTYYVQAQQLGFETLIRIREKAEEGFRQLVSSVKDYALFRLNADGYIQTWNEGARRLKGYTAEEAIGKHFSMFYPAEDIEDGKPPRELKIAVKEGKYEEEGWRLRKDGSRFWAKVIITPIFNNKKELQGFAKVTQDLSDRRKHEQMLQQKNEELSVYLDETEQFARIAAHDLNEPLRLVSSYTQLLLQKCQEDPDRDALKYSRYVTESVLRMKNLLGDMQEFISIRTVKTITQPVDLNNTLEKVKNSLKKTIAETNAVIKYERLPVVSSDPSHMLLLFKNLVENSIKFRRKEYPPEIEIAARHDNDTWTFSVKDNGIGIEEQFHERIFEIFKRLHKRDEYPGTGMGLAVCKKIVGLHGGKIWVESIPGVSSTFFFTLPFSPGDAQ